MTHVKEGENPIRTDTKKYTRSERFTVPSSNGTLELGDYLVSLLYLKIKRTEKKKNTTDLTTEGLTNVRLQL